MTGSQTPLVPDPRTEGVKQVGKTLQAIVVQLGGHPTFLFGIAAMLLSIIGFLATAFVPNNLLLAWFPYSLLAFGLVLIALSCLLELRQHQDVYQLVHEAEYYAEKSKEKGKDYYWITVRLAANSSASLDRVQKVVYHLHSTFANPRREIDSRANNFELKTYAYGQFTLRAEVHVKGRTDPIVLSRYIDF